MEIVSALKAYGRPLSPAFLAHILSRPAADVDKDLQRLETQGVLKRSADKIDLVTR